MKIRVISNKKWKRKIRRLFGISNPIWGDCPGSSKRESAPAYMRHVVLNCRSGNNEGTSLCSIFALKNEIVCDSNRLKGTGFCIFCDLMFWVQKCVSPEPSPWPQRHHHFMCRHLTLQINSSWHSQNCGPVERKIISL